MDNLLMIVTNKKVSISILRIKNSILIIQIDKLWSVGKFLEEMILNKNYLNSQVFRKKFKAVYKKLCLKIKFY